MLRVQGVFASDESAGAERIQACLPAGSDPRILESNSATNLGEKPKNMITGFLFILMKIYYTPWLATGNLMLGFQRGAASFGQGRG
jgi:hypothetical protein